MKIVVVIIARQGSSRLPGKALAEVHGEPIIGHMIKRLKSCKLVSDVMIATSTNKEDDSLEEYGKKTGVNVFRGHPEDVLDRLYHATENLNVDAIIEVGGDCPFVGPQLLKKGIALFEQTKADMVSNSVLPPFTAPNGYDFILLTKDALQRLHQGAVLKSERYQPFQYIIRNKHDFKTASFTFEENYTHWRWTLDYLEDLTFVRKFFDELYDKNSLFEFDEMNELLQAHPEIAKINEMHTEPIAEYSAWFTGSYVKEVHDDIIDLLKLAKIEEDNKDYKKAEAYYKKIEMFNKELMDRLSLKIKMQNK